MNIDLTGKRALICGSTAGIGLACAHELASLGASITLLARNDEKLRKVQADLPPGDHQHIAADFSDPGAVHSAANEALERAGTHHILINNTGGPPGGRAIDASPDEFVCAFHAHLVCNQHLARALVPGMREAGFGRIINIISTSVKAPIPGLGVSNTIRGAVASWAKTLASELGPDGITVNNVLPGFTDTERLSSLFSAKADKQGASLEDIRAAAVASIPARRLALPEETAFAVAFLASPSASYINGINLPVDGGRLQSL
ncbi:SDR family oxidoreductase [Planctomycetaceae bacterium AH-315-I19]|nr:SDR family oxidoreductase [Planctomycetaceae bacterium AH-315-I19]